MIRHGQVCVAVVNPDETSFLAQAQADESGVSDHDALQPVQFLETEGTGAGLRDGLAPPRCTIARGALPFDGE